MIFITASVISLVFFVTALVGVARAHDHNHPNLDGWFKSLHSKGGAWCCNGDDAEEAEWDTAGGKYRVKIDGQWIDIPDEAIVEGPNRVGGARVWSMHQDGKPAVRCFLPGSLI
ncbi:hypothetical protein QIH93_15120 [Bradyrhizobium ottawaense]|uniref:hypothetical protein n=1 Tax=Bradyrhizobium ottawaense TaxID=931866 RepID=UPI002714EF09|nr:hypothetical protein [Bradyrhizobium ottawaense]WLB49244.1 hypothetical protein QIH93_15120 [Bradyrhizobium ottawaense]